MTLQEVATRYAERIEKAKQNCFIFISILAIGQSYQLADYKFMLFKDVKIVDDILITIQIPYDFRASVITGISMLIVLVLIFIYFWIQRNKKQGKFS